MLHCDFLTPLDNEPFASKSESVSFSAPYKTRIKTFAARKMVGKKEKMYLFFSKIGVLT